jgi:hypothetical protein
MNALEFIQRRIDEIEAVLMVPCNGTVTASCDFLRSLIFEQDLLGEEVEHDGSGVYFFGDLAIKADGTMPKGCFVIELSEPSSESASVTCRVRHIQR